MKEDNLNNNSTEYNNSDDKYKLGGIYYNPDDNETIVDKRHGVGSTINFGSKDGKIVAIVLSILFSVPALVVGICILFKK